jgi:hypothetical protein
MLLKWRWVIGRWVMNIDANISWWRVVAGVGLFSLTTVVIADQFFEDAAGHVLPSRVTTP